LGGVGGREKRRRGGGGPGETTGRGANPVAAEPRRGEKGKRGYPGLRGEKMTTFREKKRGGEGGFPRTARRKGTFLLGPRKKKKKKDGSYFPNEEGRGFFFHKKQRGKRDGFQPQTGDEYSTHKLIWGKGE